MLTRGHFIGEIVDAFSDLSGQLATRNRLGLTDLNRHIEDFVRVSLNYLWNLSLENLNAERSNAPGLDLGDPVKGYAFQVTSQRTSAKINETLSALSDEQIRDYPRIRVFVAGRKQETYSLDAALSSRARFSEADIWDFDDLCRRCMDVQVDTLQALYGHVQSELARIKIELEIPDESGRYPTSLADYVEAVPRPQMSTLEGLHAALREEGLSGDVEETRATISRLSTELSKLPRITREFLATMIERRETDPRPGYGYSMHMEINVDKLERIVRYSDKDGELRILQAYSFVYLEEPNELGDSAYWRIKLQPLEDEWAGVLLTFAQQRGIGLQRFLVGLDFSDF